MNLTTHVFVVEEGSLEGRVPHMASVGLLHVSDFKEWLHALTAIFPEWSRDQENMTYLLVYTAGLAESGGANYMQDLYSDSVDCACTH